MSGRRAKVQIVEVPMVGPQAEGIRSCLLCGAQFAEGDLWRKVARLGRGGYAFGVHNACWAKRIERQQSGSQKTCS